MYTEFQYVQNISNFSGVRKAQAIVSTKAFQAVGAKVVDVQLEQCNQHPHDSDGYWECLVRHLALTNYHPSCTCKMGASTDPSAVVDPQLKVETY